MAKDTRKNSQRSARQADLIRQVARITKEQLEDVSEVAIYETDQAIYLYETLRRSEAPSESLPADKPLPPVQRRISVLKGDDLCAALRCGRGQEALILKKDLEQPQATVSDLLELFLTAGCPYTLENAEAVI